MSEKHNEPIELPSKVDPRGKPYTDPLEFCKELEAYLCFRLLAEAPSIPEEDMRSIKLSLVYLIASNKTKQRLTP
jgi:hypothetical protein